MGKQRYKRRNYFIKKDLQGKYIFSYFVNVVIGCFFFALIVSLFSADSLTMTYNENGLQLGRTPIVLLMEFLEAQWALIVGGSAAIIFGAMFFTHRIAGPMFRFERSLDEMIKGNFNFRILLRSKDENKDVAEKFNELNLLLSQRIYEMRLLVDQVDSGLVALAAKTDQDVLGAELERLTILNRETKALLDGFTISEN